MSTNDNKVTGAGHPAPERPRVGRAEAEALIPWVVAGRATSEETLEVEAAARRWPEISASLARARTEREAARASSEAFGMPGAGALDRLMASVKSDPVAASAPRPRTAPLRADLLDRIGEWMLSLAPRRLGALGAAAAMLLVVGSGVIGYQAERLGRPVIYKTASGPDAGPAMKGTHVLVTFRPDVMAADIGRALSEIGAEIVSGPQAGATYRIRLVTRPGESDDSALSRLMATEIAAFAVLAK